MEIFYSKDIDGTTVRLNPEESAHCVRVLRHRAGDEIAVADGRGTLLWCRLDEASPVAATATVVRREPGFGSHPYRLTLAVCPTKNMDRYEWMVEKATELGVDVIAPVIGERSERKVCKTDRLERLALSAAKQSLKTAVPVIAQPVSVMDFIAGFASGAPAAGSSPAAPNGPLKLIAYCFEGEKISIRQALEASSLSDVVVLIGPEGDFSPKEVAAAIRAGFRPVHLGPSRLRTETAALTAASALYYKYI